MLHVEHRASVGGEDVEAGFGYGLRVDSIVFSGYIDDIDDRTVDGSVEAVVICRGQSDSLRMSESVLAWRDREIQRCRNKSMTDRNEAKLPPSNSFACSESGETFNKAGTENPFPLIQNF